LDTRVITWKTREVVNNFESEIERTVTIKRFKFTRIWVQIIGTIQLWRERKERTIGIPRK